jgi:hypothetical protein
MHPGVLWHFREGKCSPFSLRGREKRHSAWRGDIPLANPIVSDGIQRCIVGGYKSVLEKLYLPTIVSDLAEGSAYAGLCVEENHGQASAFLLKLQLDMQDICKKIAAESKDCFKIQKSKGIMNEMR